MGGIFGKPSAPKAPPPPKPVPVPTVDEAANAADAADKLRRRRGAAANVLTSGNETGPAVSSGAKLLGQ